MSARPRNEKYQTRASLISSMQLKFKRVVTGYRCLESSCYNTAVWYVETDGEFFHWCPKHAVAHMRDVRFWKKRFSFVHGDQRAASRSQARSSGRR